jgi:hypothetical protein
MAIQDDRFQRWQETLIDQLGYAINLLLTLAAADRGSAAKFQELVRVGAVSIGIG